jgi:competence protein ComEA
VAGVPFRERLSMLSRGELAGIALLTAVTLAGAGFWYVRSLPRPVEIRSAPAVADQSRGAAAPSPATLFVDVAGWVRHPGVYEFAEGQRVIDAIEAAGGAREGAVLEALNLAAPLTDGVQILVPRAAAPGDAGSPAAGSSTSVATAKVNINTATASDLETLSGIGEVLAQRIVDHRTENGPFASVDDLIDVSGIGESILEQIRDDVTV